MSVPPSRSFWNQEVLGRLLMALLVSIFPMVVESVVGLRSVDKQEAAMLEESSLTYYTMRDIDEHGMKHVVDEAIAIAQANSFTIPPAPATVDDGSMFAAADEAPCDSATAPDHREERRVAAPGRQFARSVRC